MFIIHKGVFRINGGELYPEDCDCESCTRKIQDCIVRLG